MAKKVLLLYGGFSAEREVSISSKNDIAAALKSKGYDVIEHDLTDVAAFLEVLRTQKPDVVYNGLYGNWGEDGEIQGLLDMLQIDYTHSGVRASVLGMDKRLTKLVAAQNGVKVARGLSMSAAEYAQWRQSSEAFFPHVVKPVADGSSVGERSACQHEAAAWSIHHDRDSGHRLSARRPRGHHPSLGVTQPENFEPQTKNTIWKK